MAATSTKEFLDLISIDYATLEKRALTIYKPSVLDELYEEFNTSNYLITPYKLTKKDLYYHNYTIKVMPTPQEYRGAIRRKEAATVAEVLKVLLEGIEKYKT